MIRVFVLYREAPDPERYAEHVDLSRQGVPGATIRHGRILGSAAGKADFAYYFEYELALPKRFVPSILILGSAVHEALATYHRRIQAGKKCDREAVLGTFLKTWIEREARVIPRVVRARTFAAAGRAVLKGVRLKRAERRQANTGARLLHLGELLGRVRI